MTNYAHRRTLSGHDKRCSELDCGNKIHARGVCQNHYKQFHFDRSANCVRSVRHDGLVRVGVKGWGAL